MGEVSSDENVFSAPLGTDELPRPRLESPDFVVIYLPLIIFDRPELTDVSRVMPRGEGALRTPGNIAPVSKYCTSGLGNQVHPPNKFERPE